MERLEKRILVVDDDDSIRALLFTILRRRGFDVDTARNGVEALDRFARCRYSLMLLDLIMPRMNGYELLQQMERWPADQRPYIIVLTAGNEPRNLSADLVSGTIKKPFDSDILVEMMTACLSTSRTCEQLDGCPTPESAAGLEKPN